MRFSGVRGCRKGGKGMGEVFTEFRGGAGGWTQKSAVWSQGVRKMTSSCTAYGGRESHTRCHGSI